MSLGLFDLPAPLLQWINDRLSPLVPAPVEEHIRRHRLYVDETPSTAAITAADHLHGQD